MKTLKSAAFAMVGVAYGKFVLYVFDFILAAHLKPAGYLVYSEGFVAFRLGMLMAAMGLGLGVVRALVTPMHDKDYDTSMALSRQALLTSFGAGVVFAVGGYLWSDSSVVHYFMLLVPLMAMLWVFYGILGGIGIARSTIVARDWIIPTSLVAMFVLLSQFDVPVAAYSLAWAVAIVLALTYCVYVFAKRLPLSMRGTAKGRGLIQYSLPLGFNQVAIYALVFIELSIVMAYLPDDVAGRYRVAVQLGLAPTLIMSGLTTILAPKVATALAHGDLEKFKATYIAFAKLNGAAMLCVIGVLIASPHEVLGLISQDYVTDDAAQVLRILAFNGALGAVGGMIAVVLSVSGKQKQETICCIMILITCTVLGLLLTPLYGVYGAAIANVVTALVACGWRVFNLLRFYETPAVDQSWLFMFIPFVALLIAVTGLEFFSSNFWHLTVMGLGFAIVVGVGLLLAMRMTRRANTAEVGQV